VDELDQLISEVEPKKLTVEGVPPELDLHTMTGREEPYPQGFKPEEDLNSIFGIEEPQGNAVDRILSDTQKTEPDTTSVLNSTALNNPELYDHVKAGLKDGLSPDAAMALAEHRTKPKQETIPVQQKPETPVKSFIKKAFTEPFFEYSEYINKALSGSFHDLDNLATIVSRATGLPKGGVFKDISDEYAHLAKIAEERGITGKDAVSKVAAKIYGGSGQASIEIPKIMMTPGGIITTSTVSGLAGSVDTGENPFLATAKGAVEGVAMHYGLKGAGMLPSGAGEAVGGLVLGGPAVVAELQKPKNERDWTSAFGEVLVGAGMTFQGRRIPWKDFIEQNRTSAEKPVAKTDKEIHEFVLSKIKEIDKAQYDEIMALPEEDRKTLTKMLWDESVQKYNAKKEEQNAVQEQGTAKVGAQPVGTEGVRQEGREGVGSSDRLQPSAGEGEKAQKVPGTPEASKSIVERIDEYEQQAHDLLTDQARGVAKNFNQDQMDALQSIENGMKDLKGKIAELNPEATREKALAELESAKKTLDEIGQYPKELSETAKPELKKSQKILDEIQASAKKWKGEKAVNPLLSWVDETISQPTSGPKKAKSRVRKVNSLRSLNQWANENLPTDKEVGRRKALQEKRDVADKLIDVISARSETMKDAEVKKIVDNFGDVLDVIGLGDEAQKQKDLLDARIAERRQMAEETERAKPILEEINAKKQEPQKQLTAPEEEAPSMERDWDLFFEDLSDYLDSYNPARHSGRRNYELDDMAQRFVDYAQNDKSGKPLSELITGFAKNDDESTPSMIKKLRETVNHVSKGPMQEGQMPKTPISEAPAEPEKLSQDIPVPERKQKNDKGYEEPVTKPMQPSEKPKETSQVKKTEASDIISKEKLSTDDLSKLEEKLKDMTPEERKSISEKIKSEEERYLKEGMTLEELCSKRLGRFSIL
jgi:hypothetical protein